MGFGAWRFTHDDDGRAAEVLEAAVDAGLTLVDTADVYGLDWGGHGFGTVEEGLGRALARRPGLRERIVLATKGGIVPGVPYDSSGPALRAAVRASLDRLGIDRIDLYQLHRPDLLAHPAEVADALAEVVETGMVGALGVSNHTPAQTEALAHRLATRGIPLVATQPGLSVAQLGPVRDGTLDLAARLDLTVLAWSPLAGGRVATGDGLSPELLAALDDLAVREGVQRTAVAVGFVLALPTPAVALLGSQNPERIAELAAEVGRVHLDRSDWYRLLQASEGVELP